MRQYDYSALEPAKSLARQRLGGKWTAAYIIGLALIFFLTTLSHVPPAIIQLLVIVAVIASIIYGRIVKNKYNKSVTAFADRNSLSGVNVSFDTLPPATQRTNAAGELITNAYKFALDDTNSCNVFDYTYHKGSGRSRQDYSYAVAQFQTTVTFPHIFLDGKQNGSDSKYSGNQRLGLEGNFDEYFNLYLPGGTQVDVLSILSPDVMQTLIDSGRPYDIEIDRKNVSIFSKRVYYERESLPHVLNFADKLSAELDHRSVNWQQPLPGRSSPDLKVSFWHGKIPGLIVLLLVIIYIIVNVVIAVRIRN